MKFFTRTQHMGMAALIMSVSILLSRFMGLLRDKVISWQFGASGEADLYFMAFIVPDFINYMLAGGYVSITLIPLLARRFEEDEEDAWRFFSTVLWWTLIASALLTGVAWLFAPELARMVAPRFTPEQAARLAMFLRIILPAQVFFLMGVSFSALLYLRRQFSVPALTPLVYNGTIILGGLLLPLSGLVSGMEGFCWGVTVGAAVGALLLPWWAARAGGVHIRPALRHPLMGRFLLIALPLMLGQSVVMLDEQFLRIFGALVNDGAVSLLSYARRISQVPVAVVGQAAAVASYPFLAALLARGDREEFGRTLRTALISSLVLIVPLAVWMTAAAWPAMCFIFQGGRFSAAETLASTPLLQIMLLGVPLWIVQMVLGRGFYAHGDTLTPALVGTGVTACSVPAFWLAATRLGAWGVAGVSLAGVAVYVAVLVLIWRRRYGGAALAGVGAAGLRALGLSLPAGAASWWCGRLCMEMLPLSPVPAALAALAVSGAVFGLFYVLPALRLAPDLLEPILRRLGRRG